MMTKSVHELPQSLARIEIKCDDENRVNQLNCQRNREPMYNYHCDGEVVNIELGNFDNQESEDQAAQFVRVSIKFNYSEFGINNVTNTAASTVLY